MNGFAPVSAIFPQIQKVSVEMFRSAEVRFPELVEGVFELTKIEGRSVVQDAKSSQYRDSQRLRFLTSLILIYQ